MLYEGERERERKMTAFIGFNVRGGRCSNFFSTPLYVYFIFEHSIYLLYDVRFPFKRPEVLKQWIAALRRENWTPSKASRICSEHFLESDYKVRPGACIRLLKDDAVPSVFAFPEYLHGKPSARQNRKRRLSEKNVSKKACACTEDVSLKLYSIVL